MTAHRHGARVSAVLRSLLVGSAIIGLSACGGGDDGAAPAASTTTSAAVTTTTGPTASTYDTIPLETAVTEPSQTTTPADMTALRPEGIGFLQIGMPLSDLLASGTITNPHPGCEGDTEADQFDLVISGVAGVVAIVNDEADSFTISDGKVGGGGTVGTTAEEFAAASAAEYSWDLDKTFAGSHGIWIGTLTQRSTGATIDAVIDPASGLVEEAVAPAVRFCG